MPAKIQGFTHAIHSKVAYPNVSLMDPGLRWLVVFSVAGCRTLRPVIPVNTMRDDFRLKKTAILPQICCTFANSKK
ncbi:MAG: hypothetical protein M9904_16105 [Chitinophagaceae bacterium]|nr:hypothetical protein [Chitinophagaceae bacterium]